MALLDDIHSVHLRVEAVKKGQTNVEEAEKLAALRSELDEVKLKVAAISASIALLRSRQIPINGISVEKTVAKVKGVSSQFASKAHSSTLKTGARWTQLISSLGEVVSNITERRDAGWREFVATLFAGSPPEILETRLPRTPGNAKALELYRRQYLQFVGLTRSCAETERALDELRTCSTSLGEISFQQDVPADVSRFLESAATSTGFDLSQVTPDILEWLRENGLIAGYIVRQRPQQLS